MPIVMDLAKARRKKVKSGEEVSWVELGAELRKGSSKLGDGSLCGYVGGCRNETMRMAMVRCVLPGMSGELAENARDGRDCDLKVMRWDGMMYGSTA